MGILGGFGRGLKYGKRASQTKEIIINRFGIVPVEDELKGMCLGHGSDSLAEVFNPYELACYYIGNYWIFGPSDTELMKDIKRTIDQFYRAGHASLDMARGDFDKRHARWMEIEALYGESAEVETKPESSGPREVSEDRGSNSFPGFTKEVLHGKVKLKATPMVKLELEPKGKR